MYGQYLSLKEKTRELLSVKKTRARRTIFSGFNLRILTTQEFARERTQLS